MKFRKLNAKKFTKKLNTKKLVGYGVGATGAAAVGLFGAKQAARKAVQSVNTHMARVLMTDIYDENLYELFSSTYRIGIKEVVETNLRATEGKAISRPMGSPKKFPNMDSLMFNTAQLYVMPTPFEEEIDVKVTIGKSAKKPLEIEMPIIIAPMAYGVALSKKAKVALAKGAALAGTAIGSGEGPVLKEEREAAKKYIYQYHRGNWGKTEQDLTNCDAIEIQFGQGAIGGVGHVFNAKYIDNEMREAYGISPGENIVAHSRQPEVNRPADLPQLIEKLKRISGGVPIGAKIAAGKYIEADLDILCNSGVDFITVGGAEAATKGSPPILQDDFGVPTIFAINRAAEWLSKNNFKNSVSLLVGGKIRTPGDMLKACALGADACYIGSIALFAMSHTQVLKVLPYEPPTQLVWHHAKGERQLHIEEAAESLKKFLNACKEEIGEGIKGLGKLRLSEVNKEDLMALDEMIAKGCGIPMVYEPFEYEYE
ncbi:MAG: methylamine---glutamate N-methyltransferase subunit [Clostridiales bacterium]|nr:methylamine---glutamate N-methyltransferase subunit [Clostridiales bacterium]